MTLAILGLLTLLGFFLLIAGVRLVGLVAAFTGGVIGWCVGGALHQFLVPEWSVALCAATAAVAGAALGALFIRPAVALCGATVGLALGLTLGTVMVERGITPTAPVATSESPAPAEVQASSSLKQARSGLRELFGGTLDAVQDSQGRPDQIRVVAGLGARLLLDLKGRWTTVPGPTRTFLLAIAVGGATVGLGIGIVFSRWALAGASSALGAILFLGCGLPLGEELTHAYRTPDSPRAWLLLLGALTLAGWAFQLRRVEARKNPPEPAAD